MTYTYTARNIDHPDMVVTFTLENNHMRLGLAEVMEKISKVAQSDEKVTEGARQIKTQLKPSIVNMFEKLTGPVHVTDVSPHLAGERLKVSAWQRLGGLRLAPLWINMGRVDNPDAAQAFVNEIDARKQTASHVSRFFGPLDYWAGWLGLIVAIGFLLWWPWREEKDQ